MKQLIPVVSLLVLAGCGGSTPTTPSPSAPTGRGTLSLTDLTVTGSKTSTGYRYAIKITAQNTGTAVADISNTRLTFATGGSVFATASLSDAFASTAMAAGSTQASRAITITDDIAGHSLAEDLNAAVTYSGGSASESATRSSAVPPLANPTPAPTPSTTNVTLTGTVTEQGAGAVQGMNIEIRDGPDAKKFAVSDAAGRYTLPGLQSGAVTVRAWKAGYADTDQRITLAGNSMTLNFSVPKASSPTPTPSPTPQPSTAPDVEYRVLGVRANIITISNSSEGTSQFGNVSLPWSYKFSGATPNQFLYVSAQNDLTTGCIRVQVFKRGSLFKDSESCGAYVIASASGGY